MVVKETFSITEFNQYDFEDGSDSYFFHTRNIEGETFIMMLTFEKTQTLFVINDEADDRAIYLLR